MHDKVNLILGTMTFGEQVFGSDVGSMIQCFLSYGYQELDTAYVYNNGQCELLLGSALKNRERSTYKLATKVNPRITGKLDKSAVLSQLNESLHRLKVDYVDTLYLHFPDPDTPIEEALEACAQLYEENKFRELGLSNFPAWLVAEVFHICKKNGWMLPKVYEGLYNSLSRNAEIELDRALSYYGMRFYAYNPLAGGILTNKYSALDDIVTSGRFVNRPNYKERYWKESYFQATRSIKQTCNKYNVDIIEAAYRWLAYHSMLKANRGDAIIIGASNINQLKHNLDVVMRGELPDEVVRVINETWGICKADAPEYFKYYVHN